MERDAQNDGRDARLFPPGWYDEARAEAEHQNQLASTLVMLFLLGVAKGTFAPVSLVRAGLQVLLVGTASAVI